MHSAELVFTFATHLRLRTLTGTSVLTNRFEAERWQLTDDELAPQLWCVA